MRPVDALSRHASSWGWLVTVSAFALLTAGLVMAVWWAATDEERTSTYQVRGSVTAITLDIGEADLQIVGGGGQAALQVSHTDRYSFNHPAESERVVRDGELRLRSRCPAALIGSCSSAYRLRVPDNVPVRVRTTSGDVSSSGYRGSATVDTTSGSVDFDGWCGFNLQVRADVGDVRAVASCTPQRAAAALARRLGAGARAARPLPRRRRERRGQAQRARRDHRRRRPVPGPGALHHRRRPRRERAVNDGDTIDFGRRLRRAVEALEYLVLSLPLGVVCAAAAVLLVLGAALSAIWIGLPVVLFTVAGCARLAELERRQANRLLDAHIPPLTPPAHHEGTLWRRAIATLSDRDNWRMLVLVAIKLPVALLGLAAGLFPIAVTAWLLIFGVRGIGHLGDRFYVGPWTLGPLTGLLLCALALAAGILAIAALDGLRTLLASLSRALLSPGERPEGPVRELLAESLGDRTLSVAYWLPERQMFVDESGHMVRMPEPGSGRAWTAVERDGRRVAAIVHDAELATGPELVNAAAAGAALAIDNERLKADLRARVEELRVSRVRIVEAGDHARRRIERDLHDGAQQQLVSLSLDLRLLKAKLNGNEAAAATIDELSEKLANALAELRELARGIHPVILTERGLVPAVAALAQRAPVPVEADISIHERLTPAIEAAAYFVVAEALTNVAKYAQADNVLVDLRRDDRHVIVVVEDDGVGGADLENGTGLRGLVDRLSALDGTLELETPVGGGTRLRALIPCSAADVIRSDDDKMAAR